VKAVPVCPLAVKALVIAGFAMVIVSERIAVPVPVALIAPRVTFEVPVAVGVPVMRPVDVLIDRPAGSPETLKLVGVLVAVI
jgi:hypothetical protein